MSLDTRINYITFLLIGIIFLLVGNALDELSIIRDINAFSTGTGDDLKLWYDFLRPFIGDSGNGLPPPWD